MPRLTPSEYKLTSEQKKNIKEWLESDEFDKKMKKSMKAVDKMCEQMRKSAEVDPLELLKPFTI